MSRIIISLLICIMVVPAAHAAQKLALLVGVGDYIHGTSLDLKGPSNDVGMMEELLLGKFGFKPENIHKLVDAQATKANIMAQLDGWLATQARPQDTVVFYFSGHGSQIWDIDGDETDDRQDEVLCPADIKPGVPGNEISDDELRLVFEKIRATDITVIFDACHAGTGTRAGDFDTVERPIQERAVDLGYPVSPEERERAFSFEAGAADGFDLPMAGPDGSRSLEEERAFTLIASCAPAERSASTIFRHGGQRIWAGVLTYNLVRELSKVDGETTYGQMMGRVMRNVKKVNRRQTPQVEGMAERPIFANTSQEVESPNLVRLTRVEGDRVELRGNGVGVEQPGSIFKVLGDNGVSTGRVKLTRVVGHLLDGEIVGGTARAPALAVEEFHASSDEKLYVRLGRWDDGKTRAQVKKELGRLDFVVVADKSEDYFDLAVEGRVEGSALSVFTGDEIIAWVEEAGVRSREFRSKDPSEILHGLRPLLENAYAIKKLSRLDNPSPRFKVSVWVTPGTDPGSDQKKYVEMAVGDPVYFHFRSEKDAYLTLLNVGAEGGITVLFPNQYMPHNRVVAGKTYSIPSEEMGFQLHIGAPGGQEMVKAFATEFPLDLQGLDAASAEGFRSFSFSEDDGPAAVDGLAATILGGFGQNLAEGTRAIMLSAAPDQSPPAGQSTENWATDYLIIEAR
jgi:hypothetical protein